MAYCTTDDIRNAIGGLAALTWLTDLENVSVNVEACDEAIEYGAAVIDSYAAGTPGTVAVPGAIFGATVPDSAKQANVTLAVCRLYETIRREIPDDWETACTKVYEMLQELQKGTISFTGIAPAAQAVSRVAFRSSRELPRTGTRRVAMRSQTDPL